MANNLRSTLKNALGPTIHKLGLSGPYRGNVDGVHAGNRSGQEEVRVNGGYGPVI